MMVLVSAFNYNRIRPASLSHKVKLPHEAKQFVSVGISAIVPRLLGMTETAREVKHQTNRRPTHQEEMLPKCSQEASQFFNDILDLAQEQGHTIYWGTTGFSIRATLPGSDSLASIAYGYQTNEFHIYFGHLPFSEERISILRKELLELGIFKQAPKTIKVYLTLDNTQRARDAYLLMERRVKELSTTVSDPHDEADKVDLSL